MRGSPSHSLCVVSLQARQCLISQAFIYVFQVIIKTTTSLGIYSWPCFSVKPSQSSACTQQSRHHASWCWSGLRATERKVCKPSGATTGCSPRAPLTLADPFSRLFFVLSKKSQHIPSRKSSYSHIKKSPYSKAEFPW